MMMFESLPRGIRWQQGRRRGIAAGVLAAVLTVGSGGGAAFAYWSMTGTGGGSAATGDLQAVTVEAYAAPGDSTLVPGGSSNVSIRLTNANAYAVNVYSVTAAGPVTADAGHPGCVQTGVSLATVPTPLNPATAVPAHASAVVVLPAAARMDASSQSACQGATFSLPVTVEVRK